MASTYSDTGYTTPTTGLAVIRRISWGAIFAGAAVALVLQLILNLLGVGIGASAIDPAQGDSMKVLGWGSAIWVILSAILSLLAGGWVAGRLAGFPGRLYSGLHGLVAFSVVTLITFYMLTTAVGSVISGTTNFLGNAMQATASGAAAGTDVFAYVAGGQQSAESQQEPGFAQKQIRQWLERQGIETTSPQAEERITQAGLDYLVAYAKDGQQGARSQREELVSTIAQNTTLSREAVESKIAQLQLQYDEAKTQARQTVERTKDQAVEAADEAGEGIAGAAFGAFLALLLGGGAAVFGAILGTPEGAMVVPTEATTTTTKRSKHD